MAEREITRLAKGFNDVTALDWGQGQDAPPPRGQGIFPFARRGFFAKLTAWNPFPQQN